MQFPNNNDKQGNNPPPGGGKPPQFPQDWRRWMWPALLVLFLVWSLLALPELLSGRSTTASLPISYTSLFRQVEAGNVSQLTFPPTRCVCARSMSAQVRREGPLGSPMLTAPSRAVTSP